MSPSSALTPDILRMADLGQPVSGEAWHLEPHTLGANPWRVWGSGRRVPGWLLAIADLGRERWDAWVDPGGSEVERAYPGVALAQAYCVLVARCDHNAVDGIYGPRSKKLFRWSVSDFAVQDSVLAELRAACEKRGVFSGEAWLRWEVLP